MLLLVGATDSSARYWVGGTGVWTATNRLNWSYYSGGPGGAPVPTSENNVYFDANSDTGSEFEVVLERGNLDCRTLSVFPDVKLNMTSRARTTSDSILQVFGSFLTTSNPNLFSFQNKNHNIYLLPTSGTHSIDTGGNPIYCYTFRIMYGVASTATYNLLSDFSLKIDYEKHTLEFYVGESGTTLNTNGYTITCGIVFILNGGMTFNAENSLLRVFYVASSGAGKTVSNNITWRFEPWNTGADMYLAGNNQGFKNVEILAGSFRNLANFSSNTVAQIENLTIYGPSLPGVLSVGLEFLKTYTNINIVGTAINRRVCIYGVSTTQAVTINSISNVSDVDFTSILITGGAVPITGTRLRVIPSSHTDSDNLSGITPSTFSPKTVYWVSQQDNFIYNNGWSLSSGGSPSINNFPMPEDTVIIDDNSGDNISFRTNAISSAPGNFPIKEFNCSNRTTPLTLTAGNSDKGICIQKNLLLPNNDSLTLTSGAAFVFNNTDYSESYISGKYQTLFHTFTVSRNSNIKLLTNLHSVSNFNLNGPARFDANGYNVTTNQILTSGVFSTGSTSILRFGTGIWSAYAYRLFGELADAEIATLIWTPTNTITGLRFDNNLQAFNTQIKSIQITLPSTSPTTNFLTFVGAPPKSITVTCDYNYAYKVIFNGRGFLQNTTGGLPRIFEITDFKIINTVGSPQVTIESLNAPSKFVYTGQGSINFDKIVLNGTIVEPANTWFATNSTGNDPGWVYSAGPQITTSVSPVTIGQQTISVSGTSLNAGDGARIIQNSQKVDLNYTSGSSPTFDAPTLEQMFSNGVKFGTAKLAIMENK